MTQKELIKELLIREGKLIKELEAIKTLIGVYNSDGIVEGQVAEEQTHGNATINDAISPKGMMSWETYTVLVLRELGGSAKASEVAAAVIKSNPDIPEKTIKSAIRAKLSIKYRAGVISAIKGVTKKDGYVYKIED